MTRVIWWSATEAVGIPVSGPDMHITAVRSVPELLLFARNAMGDVAVLEADPSRSETDDLLLELRRTARALPVVVMCGRATCEDTIRLLRLGAFHVMDNGTSRERAREILKSAGAAGTTSRRTREMPSEPWRAGLVGRSEAMNRVVDIIRLVAARRCTVLITGETGTGKEVIARAIHVAGGRTNLPFVAVNCSAIPENLVESELFGYAKGAFTGAQQSRAGKFEQAEGGTIFLDEISELPAEAQAKLLRVLQEREVQRLGSSETVRLNVRVIAASNQNLADAVRRKQFREDLFYRLNVVPLQLPALRERPEDIPLLAEHFLERVCEAEGLERCTISGPAMAQLVAASWPGNVRQLEHAIEMAVVLSGGRAVLDASDFPALGDSSENGAPSHRQPVFVPDDGLDFEETVSTFERSLLQQALARCNGNKARAAQLLRMKRTTLLARLKSLESPSSLACA
jgi:DNA-binding NtrC family response regulator